MDQRTSLRARLALAVLAAGVGACAAIAQTSPTEAPIPRASPASERPPLERQITIQLSQAPLRDVLRFLELSANVRFAPMWTDSDHVEGLSPDTPVDIEARATPLLAVIEALLAQTDPTMGGGSTWQMAEDGRIQIGPRSRLNAYRRVVVYDIRDLLFQVKDSREAATIDLQAALQASQGSGGSTPALREPQDRQEAVPTRDPADELVELLTQFIEPEQWESNGGSGASYRVFQKGLVVRAPAYIHRQIAGDRYLPKR